MNERKPSSNIFRDFRTIDFPKKSHIVYVIGINFRRRFVPFYVGQSSRHVGRLGDYVSANVTAFTDFKVGVAIMHLTRRGYRILVKFKASDDPIQEEKQLCQLIMNAAITPNLLNSPYWRARRGRDVGSKAVGIERFVEDFLNALEAQH